ncbi:MAG: thioredoxin domain-containing protein [Anaerolineaceae bacterium]|nr:thioredoxin domain-containing protein [Anaerolineaceae bacterium]
MTDASVRVDVWSDFVCPWCFLASTSLDKLEAEQKIEIVWHSYELRPKGSPPMPETYRQRILAARPQLDALAQEHYGIKLTHGPLDVDSRAAHIGMKYAEEQGVGKAYHDAMFRAYWQYGRAIDQQDVLLDVAERVGLERDAFVNALETPNYLHQVVADITQAQALGLQGVPAMIFAGKYLVSGAQPYEVLNKVVTDVRARLVSSV